MSSLRSERYTVQMPLVRYAEEAGWTYLPPEDALLLRRGKSSPLLLDIFIRQVQRLNPGIVDALQAEEVGKRLVNVRPSIEGNLQAWEYLRGLKTVFVESERRERNLRLLDFANPAANSPESGLVYNELSNKRAWLSMKNFLEEMFK